MALDNLFGLDGTFELEQSVQDKYVSYTDRLGPSRTIPRHLLS